MRHIPEDELHAYLDQGLSRTQCVEIESHLADCVACRASRDRIAALRDRTTALLARLAPPLRVPPAFDGLRRRAAEHETARRRRMRAVAWAASLVLAVGAGWTASTVVTTERTAVASGTGTTAGAPSVAATAPPPSVAAAVPERESAPAAPAVTRTRELAPAVPAVAVGSSAARAKDSVRKAMLAVLDPAPAVELSQLEGSGERAEEFDGMWRTMSWDGAQAAAGRQLPHIDGLPVVKVQVQAGDQGSRPMMVVAQQLSSGQVIQTIEGPAAGVSQLLAKRNMTDPDGRVLTSTDSLGRALAGDQAMAMQLGDRMLAITGALPSDSLRAMIRRLNAEMRSK
jgi:hypothetical protein